MRLCLLSLASLTLFAQGQPVVAYRGIVNAASYAPPGLPNAALARGSIFTIFGAGLGPAVTPPLAFPLAPTLAGVNISVSQGGISVSAIPIALSPNQISAILPSNTPLGTAALRIGYNGRLGPPTPIEVVDNSPGIFAISQGGFGPGVITHAGNTVNSLDNSAARGQTVTVWATGLGRVPFGDNVAPTVQNLEIPITISIGERDAQRVYAGRASCCAGLDQINVTIPQDAPLGCWVPLRIKAGNTVSNTVTIAIAATPGARCADAFNPFSNLLRTSRRQGMILLDRIQSLIDTHSATSEQNTIDTARAYFLTREDSPFLFDPQFSYPPPGSCLVQQTSGNALRGAPLRGTPSAPIDAGPSIRLNTTFNGNSEIPRTLLPQAGYSAVLGSLRPSDGAGLLKLDFPASSNIVIGDTSIQPNSASLFAWAGRTTLERFRRDIVQRIQFTPNDFGASTELSIVSYSAPQNATTAITCLAAPGVGDFALSPDLLSYLPSSHPKPDGSITMLGLGAVPLARAVPFTASGLDGGLLLFSQWQTKSIYIQ